MKVRMTTVREFADKDYWPWIRGLNQVGIKVDGTALKENGKYVVDQNPDVKSTVATTTYEIIKDL